jgi:hypothetical protein
VEEEEDVSLQHSLASTASRVEEEDHAFRCFAFSPATMADREETPQL